jgi:hypothetical protein
MICWHCGRKLLDSFATVVDPIGNIHKTHKSCKKSAENSIHITDLKTAFEIENPEVFTVDVENPDYALNKNWVDV